MGEVYIGDLDNGERIVWDQIWKRKGVDRQRFGVNKAIIGSRRSEGPTSRRWIRNVICGHRERCKS